MAEIFVIKGIKSKKLQVAAIRAEIEKELIKEGALHRQELKKTTQGWEGDTPGFTSLTDVGTGDASVLTGPTGSEEGIRKWNWLNNGTSIRWALMSRDWKSKTRPGYFGAGSGAGRVVIAGRRAMTERNIGPRPGIEAREWTSILEARRKRPFTNAMIAAMRRAANKAF